VTSPPPQSVESVFSRAWELLTRNWIIIVPGLVIGLVVGIVNGILTLPAQHVYAADGSVNVGVAMAGIVGALIAGVVGLIGYIANQAFTVGMAGAAWERGTTTLADGMASFQEDAGRIIITAIGLIVLGAVAVVLSFFTFGLALIAYILFCLYAMPAAIVGNRPGFTSIIESFQIATKRFVPTLIITALIAVLYIVVGIVTAPLRIVPFLGPIIAGVILQGVVAYAVLVIVGEYLNLRNSGSIPPPGPATTPPAV
jgi:hypothetical protein